MTRKIMIKKAKYFVAVLAVAILTLALVACGGDNEPEPTPTPSPPPAATPPPTPVPTPEPVGPAADTYLDPELVGTWGMVGWLDWLMIYNEDGTGLRGMVGSFEEFDWETAGGELWQIFAGTTEHWEYTIQDDAITFVNMANDEAFLFVRIPDNGGEVADAEPIIEGDEHDEELFGTWGMYGFLEWLMIYNEDGTGLRGMEGAFEEFTWWTENGELWQNFGGNVEHWEYSIEDGVITFVNAQDADEMFWFIWIE